MPARLLQDLEPLTHAARQQRMALLGRQARAGDAAARSDIAGLAKGDGYERRLALQAGWGSRDALAAVRGLSDPSRLLRTAAGHQATAFCDAAQLVEALERAPPPIGKRLLQGMRRRRRTAELDAYLELLAERNDPRLGCLIPYGSPGFVARHLAARAEDAGPDWHHLARAHPGLTAAYLTQATAGAAELDGRLLSQARIALPELSDQAPDAALDLVLALSAHVPLSTLPLMILVQRRPNEAAALHLAAGDRLPVSFAPVAHRLQEDRLLALLDRFGGIGDRYGGPAAWLRRLPPGQRGPVYHLAGRGWRDADGAIALPILMLLPHADRVAEARRHLDLPALATRPVVRLPYASLLGWTEAMAILTSFIRDPDADLRAAALHALAGCVRFERSRAPDLLTILHDRRHEQDPVRGSLLGGLADLPPSVWQEAHLDGLGVAFRQALDATDLSQLSASHIERLLVAQLPRYPGWAAAWLAQLARERGTLGAYANGDRVTPAGMDHLAPALMPVIREWRTRENDGAILNFAGRVGRRLRCWNGLADVPEAMTRGQATVRFASLALQVLARHRPDRLHRLIPLLLRDDAGWITQAPVQTFLHLQRQDLLTPYLGRTAITGRFTTGRTYLVLPFRTGFKRWTPAQQRSFKQPLLSVIEDSARNALAAVWAIAQLAALPDAGCAELIGLAGLEPSRIVVRDAALRGLGRRDSGDGLPTLLAAMDDSRARVAIYEVRRCVLEMPPGQALAVLRGVPLGRVTVAKEVVRLAGDLADEDAYRWMLGLDGGHEGKALHRDVRVALLRGLWNWLEQETTWPVLERAAASPDPALAGATARTPDARLSAGAAGRLSRLLASLLLHPEPRVRLTALGRCATAPLADREEALLGPLLGALASPFPDECRAAARAVFATYAGRRAARVGEAARTVRDSRQAVAALAAELRGWAGADRGRRAATVHAVLDAWQPDPMLAGTCAGLAASSLPGAAAASYFRTAVDSLHAGAVQRGIEGLGASRAMPAELESFETELAGAGDPRLRRLALAALVAQCGTGRGWSEERLARITRFRADPAPLVAEAAQFTFPPGVVE